MKIKLYRTYKMKISEKSNQEIIDQLTNIANNFDSTKENYLLSYPHFLNYYKILTTIHLLNLSMRISSNYSWMPTIINSIKLEKNEKLISILNEVKQGKIINEVQLATLKTAFNNSLVET